jgi:hypothetical protein
MTSSRIKCQPSYIGDLPKAFNALCQCQLKSEFPTGQPRVTARPMPRSQLTGHHGEKANATMPLKDAAGQTMWQKQTRPTRQEQKHTRNPGIRLTTPRIPHQRRRNGAMGSDMHHSAFHQRETPELRDSYHHSEYLRHATQPAPTKIAALLGRLITPANRPPF